MNKGFEYLEGLEELTESQLLNMLNQPLINHQKVQILSYIKRPFVIHRLLYDPLLYRIIQGHELSWKHAKNSPKYQSVQEILIHNLDHKSRIEFILSCEVEISGDEIYYQTVEEEVTHFCLLIFEKIEKLTNDEKMKIASNCNHKQVVTECIQGIEEDVMLEKYAKLSNEERSHLIKYITNPELLLKLRMIGPDDGSIIDSIKKIEKETTRQFDSFKY